MAAPNIVVVLTDDQEDTGSMAYMPKVQALAEQGVTFKNSFVNFSLCSAEPSVISHRQGRAQYRHQGKQTAQRRRLGDFQAGRSGHVAGVAEGGRLQDCAHRQI
jgi:arylsulfatase A-like enzyme